MDKINKRLGDVVHTEDKGEVSTLEVEIPTRGLLGLSAEIMNSIGIELKMESDFLGY